MLGKGKWKANILELPITWLTIVYSCDSNIVTTIWKSVLREHMLLNILWQEKEMLGTSDPYYTNDSSQHKIS